MQDIDQLFETLRGCETQRAKADAIIAHASPAIIKALSVSLSRTKQFGVSRVPEELFDECIPARMGRPFSMQHAQAMDSLTEEQSAFDRLRKLRELFGSLTRPQARCVRDMIERHYIRDVIDAHALHKADRDAIECFSVGRCVPYRSSLLTTWPMYMEPHVSGIRIVLKLANADRMWAMNEYGGEHDLSIWPVKLYQQLRIIMEEPVLMLDCVITTSAVYVFDCMSWKQFDWASCDESYYLRRERLEHAFDKLDGTTRSKLKPKLMPQVKVNEQADISMQKRRLLSRLPDDLSVRKGVVLKHRYGLYRFGRNQYWLQYNPED